MNIMEKIELFTNKLTAHHSFLQGAMSVLSLTDLTKLTERDLYHFCLGLRHLNGTMEEETMKMLNECEKHIAGTG